MFCVFVFLCVDFWGSGWGVGRGEGLQVKKQQEQKHIYFADMQSQDSEPAVDRSDRQAQWSKAAFSVHIRWGFLCLPLQAVSSAVLFSRSG